MSKEFDKFKKDEKVDELRDVLTGKKGAPLPSDETKGTEAAPQTAPQELPEADRSQLGEEIQVLEEKLKQAENQLKDEKDKYLRLLAEFENFRKRMEREKDESTRYANEKILKEIFPVIDNLEMTIDHAAGASADKQENPEGGKAAGQAKAILEGVGMVLKQLEKSLEKFGLKKVGIEGEMFDPHRHEAIGQVESSDYKPGTVVQVHRSGFTLHDRLIRPALVTVSAETLH
ncbi:MAG: nucleotide exchange factor GrpE [Deltaproteobacteria bacterium]|nr:nucleotide exchange factor GrpE [Deltaproteobacteria bacterium]